MWWTLDKFQKENLILLKNQGRSYSDIASTLSISKSAVKSFFSRLKNEENSNICKNCGVTLEKCSKSNLKKFCSDSCRYKWWRKNLENNRSYLKIHICKYCDKKFKSFDNKDRKYCSHKCYINDRFKPKKGKFINDTRTIWSWKRISIQNEHN